MVPELLDGEPTFIHCADAQGMSSMGYHVEPLRWSIVWRWMPVNLLFVGKTHLEGSGMSNTLIRMLAC